MMIVAGALGPADDPRLGFEPRALKKRRQTCIAALDLSRPDAVSASSLPQQRAQRAASKALCAGAPDPISLSRLAPVSRRSEDEGILLEAARLMPSGDSGWKSAVFHLVQQMDFVCPDRARDPAPECECSWATDHNQIWGLQVNVTRHFSQCFMQVGSPRYLDREQDMPEPGGGCLLFLEGHRARRPGLRLPRLDRHLSYQNQTHTIPLCYGILSSLGRVRVACDCECALCMYACSQHWQTGPKLACARLAVA